MRAKLGAKTSFIFSESRQKHTNGTNLALELKARLANLRAFLEYI